MDSRIVIFVCSTFDDLGEERRAVLDAIRRLQLQHDSMEFFGAREDQPIDTCLNEVRRSDLLVVIVGHRYGSMVPEMNVSFPEAEYREGYRLNKPCLVYMRDDEVPILPKHMEKTPEKIRLLDLWKATLKDRHTVARFKGKSDLAVQVIADISRKINTLETDMFARNSYHKNLLNIAESIPVYRGPIMLNNLNNDDIISFLETNDGKITFIDAIVDSSVTLSDQIKIIEDYDVDVDLIASCKFNSMPLPLPNNGKGLVNMTFYLLEGHTLHYSAGGTGIVTVAVKGIFEISRSFHGGPMMAFHLKEIDVPFELRSHLYNKEEKRKEIVKHKDGVERTYIRYADVNNDSRNELLVEYPGGAHGTVLNVYGWKDQEFVMIGQLGSGTPEGFQVGDYDGDGRIEISTKETDWETGLPYVSAPRMTVIYRWNGVEFEKIKEIRDHTHEDVGKIGIISEEND